MQTAETSGSGKARPTFRRERVTEAGRFMFTSRISLVGYARILASCGAFAVAFRKKQLFVVLYLVRSNYTSWAYLALSCILGFMPTQLQNVLCRMSTAALLVVLTHLYKSYFLLFLGLLALDISSHWLQMYSTLLGTKTSHKDMGDSKSWLLSIYYTYRIFMGYCCVGSEVLYIVLYLLPNRTGNLLEAVKLASQEQSVLFSIGLLAAPGYAIKQWINVVQMKAAADITVEYDIKRDSQKDETD